jgi:hypothetical protein
MRPALWQPPIALSAAEQQIVRRVRRAKLFVFLREQRHLILDAPFQEELATMYPDPAKGRPLVSPAVLVASLPKLVHAVLAKVIDFTAERLLMKVPLASVRLNLTG